MLIHLIRKNYLFFLPYAVLLAVLGYLQLTHSQEQLMQWVNVRNSPAADVLFPYATYLGDGAFFVVVSLILMIYSRPVGIMSLASFALSSLVSLFLKQVMYPHSLRPLKMLEHSTFQYHLIKGLDIHSYNSFPSGHTTSAFALFGLLAFVDNRKASGWIFLLIAVLTGYSRVYLFQHFVEDAYAGSLIGTGSSVVVYLAWERWAAAKKNRLLP
ncbi:hypothetical protein GCM10027578_11770 [Spirosoma luteolum]